MRLERLKRRLAAYESELAQLRATSVRTPDIQKRLIFLETKVRRLKKKIRNVAEHNREWKCFWSRPFGHAWVYSPPYWCGCGSARCKICGAYREGRPLRYTVE